MAKKPAKSTTSTNATKKTAKKTTKKAVLTPQPAKKAAAARTPKQPTSPATSKSAPTRAAAAKSTGAVATKTATKTATGKATKAKASTKATARQAAEATPVTRIVAHLDVGFGNQLYIRGEGGELSWDSGVPMTCTGASEWVFETAEATSDLEVKFLINDQVWSEGENLLAPAGASLEVEPTF